MQHFRPSHLVALAAILILGACEKVPLTAPTDSKIVLSIDKTGIPIGGTATITAVVTEASGTAPHNGTIVTFSGAFGTITPQEAATVGGIARATFTGTGSGVSEVGAFSGGAVAEKVKLNVGGAAAERITVRAEPGFLSQNGGTVTVIANVQDAGGQPLPNTTVNFSADNGTLNANAAVTDSSGEARVTLTTNRTTKVTAQVGGKPAVDFTITALAAPTLTVGGCSTTPFVGLAVNCTITPAVPTGGAPIASVTVNWGDGSATESLGPITSATVVSHIYARAGNYTVTATATDTNGQVGRASAAVNVLRTLPTVAITCPTTPTVGVAGSFTVTPPANPPIQISNITVDFGDGTSRNLGAPTGVTSFSKAYAAEGGYTATATITDVAGQTGSASCSVVVGRAASPTITTFEQTSNKTPPAVIGVAETFRIVVAAASGLSIRQVTVTQDRTGAELYNQSGGGTFATDRVLSGDILTLRVTDSAGNVSQAQLVVDQ